MQSQEIPVRIQDGTGVISAFWMRGTASHLRDGGENVGGCREGVEQDADLDWTRSYPETIN